MQRSAGPPSFAGDPQHQPNPGERRAWDRLSTRTKHSDAIGTHVRLRGLRYSAAAADAPLAAIARVFAVAEELDVAHHRLVRVMPTHVLHVCAVVGLPHHDP